MTTFFIIVAFALGFFVGVIERKVNNTTIKIEPKKIIKKIVEAVKHEPKSEILLTPSDEDYDKEAAREFSKKMR